MPFSREGIALLLDHHSGIFGKELGAECLLILVANKSAGQREFIVG